MLIATEFFRVSETPIPDSIRAKHDNQADYDVTFERLVAIGNWSGRYALCPEQCISRGDKWVKIDNVGSLRARWSRPAADYKYSRESLMDAMGQYEMKRGLSSLDVFIQEAPKRRHFGQLCLRPVGIRRLNGMMAA